MPQLRKLSARLGRRLYLWGRGEQRNSPQINGEYRLLRAILAAYKKSNITLLDVGANLGNWTLQATKMAAENETSVKVHCFEPSMATRQMLQARLSDISQAMIIPMALSDSAGTANFFSSGAGKGTNSLNASSGPNVEQVTTSTVDKYMSEVDLKKIAFVKIDTEGYDFSVIKGSRRSLEDERIDVIQFEYNWRWIQTATSLRSVFDFTADLPYRVVKVTSAGLLVLNEWHFELDKFFEGNYALLRKGLALDMPLLPTHVDETNTLVW